MKILVCGGRHYADAYTVNVVLSAARSLYEKELCIIQGGANGADKLARNWCCLNGVACITLDAMWTYYGKKAGTVRNAWMLKHTTPDRMIAFPGGAGTANMCIIAREKGIDVVLIEKQFIPNWVPL